MPSVPEIFTVSDVGVGASVASGVEVLEVSTVSEVSNVGVFGAGVELGGGGVAALWQAARIKIKKRRINFFIEFYFVGQACSLTFFENMGIGELQTCPTEPVVSPSLPDLHKNWDLLYQPFARL
jgi:hypothetical protein